MQKDSWHLRRQFDGILGCLVCVSLQNAFFLNFFLLSDVKCPTPCCNFAPDFKKHTIMLTYQLLKIAPDGGQFAASTLGLLFGLMEAGLVLWFVIATLVNAC